ncbi:hypothetical protein BJ912DRAFT_945834 [Pholiota molesta]|nr:hypothetical protein BJ912DRAFT_945834 [Pholiota molesta]
MSGRLASFRGPSTPTSSPAQHKPQNPPASPSRLTESTFHRKTRTLLQELRSITETWEICNALKLLPDSTPRSRVVMPKLAIMDTCIAKLDVVLAKLQKQFSRMNAVIDNLETVLIDASKVKGWQWVQQEPLWVTWSLENFVSRVPAIIKPYHRSLAMHTEIVDELRSHSITFEKSRDALNKWDICEAEVERWGNA